MGIKGSALGGGGYIDPSSDWPGWDGTIQSATTGTVVAAAGKKLVILNHSLTVYQSSGTGLGLLYQIGINGSLSSYSEYRNSINQYSPLSMTLNSFRGLKLSDFTFNLSGGSGSTIETSLIMYIEVDE